MTEPAPVPPRDEAPCALCGHERYALRFEKLSRRFLECSSCGLVWIEPMPSAESLDAYYQAAYSGGRYAHFAEAEDVRRLIAEHRLQRIAARVGGPGVGTWLDVGCTTGDFVAACARAGASAEGIDISREAVDQAARRGLTVHHSRVEDYTPASPCHVVTAFDVIEHLLDPRAFVQRLRGWLRDGGWLVLTTPNVKSLFPRWLMGRHWFYYWPDEHLFYFDPKTITRLLEEEGFADVQVARAYKPLTLDYASRNLETFNRALGRVAGGLVSVLPERLRSSGIPMYIGEMIVTARRGEGAPS